MRACIQRVLRASVVLPEFGNEISGQIEEGLLVLLGVGRNDGPDQVELLVRKICGLRIFDDENGKMNLELSQVGGAMLVVSQFTLYADCVRGKRPGFDEAAPPEKARILYEQFVQQVQAKGIPVATGRFQESMQVELVNNGPITIWLDTDQLKRG